MHVGKTGKKDARRKRAETLQRRQVGNNNPVGIVNG
jgi:hypothetical protein